MAARRYERGDFLPSLERRNDAHEDEGSKENAERIQASGEGLSKFKSYKQQCNFVFN